jgi:hypothetical protein
MGKLVMSVWLCCLATACGTSGDLPPPCVADRIVPSSSSREPGTLQDGLILSRDDASVRGDDPATPFTVAARPGGGVLCAMCGGVVAFTADLDRHVRVDTGGPARIAVAPDDGFYALVHEAATGGTNLVAYSGANEVRWTQPLAGDPSGVSAAAEGPYVQLASNILGFDALTGELRSTATVEGGLIASARGSVFTTTAGQNAVTLRRLDPAGGVMWSHTITAVTNDPWLIQGYAANADGAMVIFGSTSTTLDFGDRMFVPHGNWFIAGFDATGATQGAFSYNTFTTHIAVTAQGEILIAGQDIPVQADVETNAVLSVATLDGISRTLHIDGPGPQVIDGLTVTPDGIAWISVSTYKFDYDTQDPVMQLGGQTFTEAGAYLFKIVP